MMMGQPYSRCTLRALAVLPAALIVSFTTAVAQSTLYVDDSAGGSNDGSSWCDAFLHLQDALDAAVASAGLVTEILVAEGLYRPDEGATVVSGDRTAAFEMIGGVALKGGFAGCGASNPDSRDIELHPTFLSGDLLGNDDGAQFPGGASFSDNSFHVVVSVGAAGPLLEGFTIKAGNADGLSPDDNGGAIHVSFGSLVVRQCSLIGNSAAHGGAIHNNGGDLDLVDCLLTGNAASAWGGALDNFSGNATLVNCILVGNTAVGEGGAVHSDMTTLTVTNSTLCSNSAGNRGGGVFNYAAVESVLTNVIIWDSTDASGGGEDAQVFNNPGNAISINHSCVDGWTGTLGGVGNDSDDPAFVRLPSPGPDGLWNAVGDDHGDLHLIPGSSSINAGDNNADTDAQEPGVQPLPAFDHDGKPRLANGIVDRGALEQDVPQIPTMTWIGLIAFFAVMLATGAMVVLRARRTIAERESAGAGPR